jgi:putative nucleotidyltransferase with HDIG domain
MDEGSAAMTPVTALVFDWGDTLMRVFTEYDGPMVDWPQVAAVEGAGQVLQQLQEHYRLFVATNAAESSAQLVGAALQRAGLDHYFERIFTMHELGCLKPDPAFFHALSRQITIPGEACVMIGDDLRADISGSLQAGWRAVWLNPSNQATPGLLPLHDADISRLAQLSSALSALDLPRFQTCLNWLLAEGSPHNILTHVMTVAALSYRMALWMRARGSEVNPLLAHRGGLLHDLTKAASFSSENKSKDHGEVAAHLLMKLQQPQLAEIARRHLLFRPLEQDSRPETNEQKLVYFMDKLVEGSHLVSLEERIDHLRQRYHLDPAKLDALMPHLHGLRAELCAQAGFHPDDLISRMKAALFDK